MSTSKFLKFFPVLLILRFSFVRADLPGKWELLVPSVGISSMHTAVTRFNTVVLLDRTRIGPSRIHGKLPCPNPTSDNCTAHSVLLDLQTNRIRSLTILTDTWCSSGQFLPDGTLLQTGGDLDGFKKIRKFAPCEPDDQSCDWEELKEVELHQGRWYATNQILPDGSIIVIGGRSSNTVEYYPPRAKAVEFPFLLQAEDDQMDNLYPYVHLLPNGELFVFANNKAVSYDYEKNIVSRYYPNLEGGPRNYPSAGSSVMLPLMADDNYSSATVVVCGGAEYGAYLHRTTDSPARGSCGRIEATRPGTAWEMEDMPFGRIMGDMVVLPTSDVLIVNGAMSGTQGFERASDPCLFPVLYRPDQPIGLRFMTLNPGTVPRMYHSTANLLPDGRVLIAGSNPHYFYKFDAVEFPTELRVEAFSPEYLSEDRRNIRPRLVELPERVRYGEEFDAAVTVDLPVVGVVEMNLASAPFATHSFSQGQRLVKLRVEAPTAVDGTYRLKCTAPPDGRVAPPGYYMAFAVNLGVPSVARWLQLVA